MVINRILFGYLVVLILFLNLNPVLAWDKEKLNRLEERVSSYKIDKSYKDDPYGLMVVKAALKALKEGSGGIGACLVNATSGEVVEYGRNRQYTDYFRSDLHAEMDLLNRYENRVKKRNKRKKGWNPRDCQELVLVTSVEPCPMCLTRIINAGIKTMLYVVEDKQGGMVSRMEYLPPFWRNFAADRDFRQADCSPELRQIALDLFNFSDRSFAKDRDKQ
ncbi:MAG TPA: deaminase [Desulfohalobiaceae bacterium]|nr:deaminase [Desulfohalobiaceae bacterium]